jgi:hypothetical protein
MAPGLIKTSSSQIAEALLKSALDEIAEFGIDSVAISRARWDELIENVPSLAIFKKAFATLLEQTSGMHGSGHIPEHSAGGDLMHLIYLPHCDLWRGDRRFSNVVKGLSAVANTKVVARLTDLPERIERLLV